MQVSRQHWYHYLALIALGVALVVMMLPKPLHAQTSRPNSGYYTTTTTTRTTTSSTDPVTGVTTSNETTTTQTPRELFSTRDRLRVKSDRTSDLDARYPYDNTNGRNRSDVDAVRSGFDDPRNPWDGRYMNDNPRNSANNAGSNATVNRMRGNENYRPGSYGTYSATRGRNR